MATKDPKYKRQDRSKYFSKGDYPGIKSAEDRFVEWYSEPATRRRFPGTEKELDKGVQKALDTKAYASFNVPNHGDAVYEPGYTTGYREDRTYGEIPKDDKNYEAPEIRLENTSGDVFAHELTHATQFDDKLGAELRKTLGEGSGALEGFTKKYLGRDGELYGNFHQIREKLGLKAWERSFTPERVIELIKFNGLEEDEDVRNFIDNWGPEKFSEALNKIANVEADAERLERLNFTPDDTVISRPSTLYT